VPIIEQIVVVSDGSTDRTVDIARSRNVEVVDLISNVGKGGALYRGLEYIRTDIVLLLDADLVGLEESHVLSLIQPVSEREADVTIGVFEEGRFATDLAQKIAPLLSGQRAIRTDVIQNISDMEVSRYGVEVAMNRYIRKNGVTMKLVKLPGLTHVMKEEKKEINAVVLDILPKGYPDDPRPMYKREPIIQAVGVEQFKLLELIPKNLTLEIGEQVYIGGGERPKIERVKRRLRYDELTHSAVQELSFAIERIVKDREQEFVDFYNRAIPITPKLHMLHLLPGIGKKLMWEILEEREKKPFESFADISQRIKAIPHPDRMILNRVLEELQDPNVKYHLFTSR